VSEVDAEVWKRALGETNFNFRKLLYLHVNGMALEIFSTYKTQFLETNLTFHTVSTLMRAIHC